MGLKEKRIATEMGRCPDKIFLIKFSKTENRMKGEGTVMGGGGGGGGRGMSSPLPPPPPLHVRGQEPITHKNIRGSLGKNGVKQQKLASEAGRVVDWRRGRGAPLSYLVT